jgi:hypothetical protein
MKKHARSLVALGVLVAALAVPAATTAANNPAANVSIASSADWTSPATIVVYLTVSCAPYFAGAPEFDNVGFASVTVNQAGSGSSAGGAGSSQTQLFTCDGQNHKLALQVQPGPWQLGTAIASAYACGAFCDTAIKQIRITRL